MLADTLGSVSVIFSSFLVTNYGWNVADPICSMFIACVIGYSAMPLLNDTLCLLTLKVPHEFHSQLMVKKVSYLIFIFAYIYVYFYFLFHYSSYIFYRLRFFYILLLFTVIKCNQLESVTCVRVNYL